MGGAHRNRAHFSLGAYPGERQATGSRHLSTTRGGNHMATDSTHLPSGQIWFDASVDMAVDGPASGPVQLAAAETAATQVTIPQGEGRQVVVVPVKPGEMIALPTDSPEGLLAKLGADGNLAIVVDGRTII